MQAELCSATRSNVLQLTEILVSVWIMNEDKRQMPAMARDSDARIGRYVAELRVAAGLTQSELAQKMRALGWKWSQQSCWAIENGRQTLRLPEANDLAEVLGVEVWWLLPFGDGATEPEAAMRRDMRSMYLARAALDEAALNYEHIRQRLALDADTPSHPLPEKWRAEIAALVGQTALSQVQAHHETMLAPTFGKRPEWAKRLGQIATAYYDSWKERGRG